MAQHLAAHRARQSQGSAISCLAAALLITLCNLSTSGFAADADPFAGRHVLSNSAEIALTHTRLPYFVDGVEQQAPEMVSELLDLSGFGTQTRLDNSFEPTDTFIDPTFAAGQRGHDLVAADFAGDRFDEVVAAWEAGGGDLRLRVSRIGQQNLSWQSQGYLNLPNTLTNSVCGAQTNHRVISARFDTDVASDVVLAWWASDDTLQISVQDVLDDLSFSERVRLSAGELTETDLDCGAVRFDITAGDFDGDGRDELLVVSAQGETTNRRWGFKLQLFAWNDTSNQLEQSAETVIYDRKADSAINSTTYDLRRLVIAAGDFTGDLIDEVALAWTMTAEGDEPLLVHAYAFSVGADLQSINAETTVNTAANGFEALASSDNEAPRTMATRTKDINSDGREELFLAYRGTVHVWRTDDDLNFNNIFEGSIGIGSTSNSDWVRPFDIADLNSETALGSEETADTAASLDNLNPGVWRYELVAVEEDFRDDDNSNDDYNQLTVRVHELRTFDEQIRTQELVNYAKQFNDIGIDRVERRFSINRRAAIALGDFDGDAVILGKPRRSTRTDIARPLVVLNAPPVHYDLLDDPNCPGGVCDVARCFSGSMCNFIATHERIQQQIIDVTTQINADWTLSKEIQTGLDVSILGLPLKVQERMKGSVGEKFSRSNRYTRTITISDRQTAIVDDFIYAMVVDYEIWEYPVYANGEIQGWTVAVVPAVTQNRWFDSKSYSAASYIPGHEVGNVISYQSLDSPLENPRFEEDVRYSTGDGRELGGFASSQWTLTQVGETMTETARESSSSVEGTPNLLGLRDEDFGLETPFLSSSNPVFERVPTVNVGGTGVSVEGSYEQRSLVLSSSTYRDERGLKVDFGPIDLSLGNTRYTVTPYVYWAKNGAIVLDYGVEFNTGSTGSSGSFWSKHYGSTNTSPGKSDPSFILPWRYDPEKGMPLSEPAQRFETRDIQFVPRDPEPGDTVTIVARVHNWSLIDALDPLQVSFYNGDPNNGGELIVSPSGDTSVTTTDRSGFPTGLQPRGVAFAQIDWTLPNTNDTFYRIYAQIDPVNAEDEIHENNNLGWALLSPAGAPLPLSELAASLLPSSRSATVNNPVTAFATVINTGANTATECALSPRTMVPGEFSWQSTDPATNLPVGEANDPVDIAAGASQSFVFAITPTSVFAPSDVQIGFDCSNTARALPISGVNTLLLSSTGTPSPDVVALGATASSDGILRMVGGSGAFAVATSNVAASGNITITADTGGTALPLILNVCQTDPGSGVCINPTEPGPTATLRIDGGETPTFGVFASSTASIPLDPAKNRVLVRFRDGNGVVRGSTSVAVTNQ